MSQERPASRVETTGDDSAMWDALISALDRRALSSPAATAPDVAEAHRVARRITPRELLDAGAADGSLPVGRHDGPAEVVPSDVTAATPRPGPRPLSVLVVEDEEDSAESMAELIRMSGHRAAVARTGAEALRRAADDPDVVLLDMRLPDADGCEVARKIGAGAGARRPFLVAVTGRGTDADLCRSEDAGIDLHLIKPVEPAALLALLARFARVVG